MSLQALMKNLFKSRNITEPGPSPAASQDPQYLQRLKAEQGYFKTSTQVHELPAIFHYWSNKHLAPPKFHPFGIRDPEHFYLVHILEFHRRNPERFINMVSHGAGNCDMEARLARKLMDEGVANFRIECLDITEEMLERGRAHARDLGVGDKVFPATGDFNFWRPERRYEIIIANQCLHHVMELENLFASIRDALDSEGYFLTSDMIGRNGHLRWPEALDLVQEFWQELPSAYRYNQLLLRQEEQYINHDCSTDSFEGIRAQDILPLLIENFHFDLFIPFSNIICVFIDRTFGHNFNADGDWDKDFIDRVHARDEAAIMSGEIKPTQMLAAMRNRPTETRLVHPRLTPEFCVRAP